MKGEVAIFVQQFPNHPKTCGVSRLVSRGLIIFKQQPTYNEGGCKNGLKMLPRFHDRAEGRRSIAVIQQYMATSETSAISAIFFSGGMLITS